MIIKISGKAHDVFGALAQIVNLYGNLTLQQLQDKIK